MYAPFKKMGILLLDSNTCLKSDEVSRLPEQYTHVEKEVANSDQIHS